MYLFGPLAHVVINVLFASSLSNYRATLYAREKAVETTAAAAVFEVTTTVRTTNHIEILLNCLATFAGDHSLACQV